MKKIFLIVHFIFFLWGFGVTKSLAAEEKQTDLLDSSRISTDSGLEGSVHASAKKWLLLARSNILWKKFDASLGYSTGPRYQFNLGYTQFPKQDGFHPDEMLALSGWYYLEPYRLEGLHFGIGATAVRRSEGIYTNERNYRREKFGLLYQIGYDGSLQIGQQQLVISTNLGYGSGSPYVRDVDESSRSFMGGIFELSYLELGIGKRF